MTNDLYSTPSWCVRRLVENFPELCDLSVSSKGVWLEPAAGKGNLIREFNSVLPQRPIWDAFDVDEQHKDTLKSLADVTIGDFTHMKPVPRKYEVIVTNPPYSIAMEFVEKAREFEPKYLILLLRTNFLASQTRADFMREFTPDVYLLPNRPCFVRGKSDNTEYMWAVWDRDKTPGTPGKILMLNSTSVAERKLG